MLAYHNDPQIKQQILEQLQRHYDADEIVKGKYWENGKGCAVGCTLHTDQYKEYESRFGIPKVLAHLEDAIFEGLPNEEAKNWPIRFISAIQVGADLSTIWRDFAIWLLIDPADGVIKYTPPGTYIHRVIMKVATLYRDGYTKKQMMDAADFAYADSYAAFSADSYNASAHAYHAAAAIAADDASYAAYAASAASAAYNSDAASATKHAAYIKMSNKLIELLQKQEVKHASLPQ